MNYRRCPTSGRARMTGENVPASCRSTPTSGTTEMYQRRIHIVKQRHVGTPGCFSAANQHIIAAFAGERNEDFTKSTAQSPLDAIACHRISKFLSRGHTHSHTAQVMGASLHDDRFAHILTARFCGSYEIATFP